MSTVNARAAASLVAQSGLVTGRQLDEAGVGRRGRTQLTRSTSATPVLRFKSVYQAHGESLPFERLLIALTLAHPRSFITGVTAGGVLGVRRLPSTSEIVLCVPHPRRLDVPPGVRLRQSRSIGPRDTQTLPSGLVVASYPRLAFDLAAELTEHQLRSVIEQLLHRRWITETELEEVARRLCHPRRPGSARFAEAISERRGRRPVESDPELLVLRGLLARGVPAVPQHEPIPVPGRRSLRVDLAVPAARWAVEVDVHPSHDERDGAADKRRDRQMHRHGWQIERVSPDDLDDLDALCDELADLYRARLLAA